MTTGAAGKIAASAIALAVIAGILISSRPGSGVGAGGTENAVARMGGFDIRVNIVGALDAERSYIVSSEIKGDRGKIIHLADDGAWVEKGDVLVRFDPTPFEEEALSLSGKVKGYEAMLDAARQAHEWEKSQVEREVKVAELGLQAASLELSKLINGDGPLALAQIGEEMEEKKQEHLKHEEFVKDLEDLERRGFSNPAEIALARAKSARLKKLYEIASDKHESFKNYVLPSQIESLRMKVRQAEIEAEQAKKGGEFKIGKAAAAIEKARQDLASAQELLRQAQAELEKTVIHAPFDGIVVHYETFRDNVKRKPRVGDTVWRNQPILYLPDITSFVVKTKVREIDLSKVSAGQAAEVTVDAYPGAAFSGSVSSIGALADSDSRGLSGFAGAEKTFQVTVAVKESDRRLRPGMTARVSILSETVENTLIVPAHSVFTERGRKFVYRRAGGGYEKTYVRLGRQNEDYVEILSGVGEGDAVSLAEPGAFLF